MPKGKINTNRKGLTKRQIGIKREAREDRFIDEYMESLNGTLSAINAGFAVRSAATTATRLLKKPHIAAKIAERRKAMEAAASMTREEWARRMELLSRASLKQVATWGQDGETSDAKLKIKSSEEMTDEEAWLLNEVTLTKGKYGNSLGIKLNSKLSALSELGKALGYYPEKKGEGENNTVNNLNINLHRGSDPMDLSALNSEEKAQLRALFAKMAPKVIGEGKGG